MIKGRDITAMIKAVISAAVMFAAMYILYAIVGGRFDGVMGNLITCAVCGGAGIAVYGICVYLLRIEEIRDILKKH